MQPTLDWYLHISKENNLSPRCPFASVHKCPRFYESLSLLDGAGSTKIEANDDKKLEAFCEKSKFWPVIAEQAVSIAGPPESPQFLNFCPEVSFKHFGYFASSLFPYGDEIDVGAAHAQLSMKSAPRNDWRWAWCGVSAMHYTHCQLYSLLKEEERISNTKSNETRVEKWFQKIRFPLMRP